MSTSGRAQVRLNHIAISVLNLDESAGFYKDVIGLDTIPEPFHDGKHIWFAVGDHAALHLISGASMKTGPDKNSHLCFSVPSVSDFVEKLKAKNISFEDWPGTKGSITTRADGVKQIYFQDPNGWWIEINDAR